MVLGCLMSGVCVASGSGRRHFCDHNLVTVQVDEVYVRPGNSFSDGWGLSSLGISQVDYMESVTEKGRRMKEQLNRREVVKS